MKYFCKYSIALFGIILFYSCTNHYDTRWQETISNRDESFNLGWKFMRDSMNGAETISFNDSSWKSIDLPHDFSMENLPVNPHDTVIGPFSKRSVGTISTGYTVGGTAWYRKTFTLDSVDKGKSIIIHFDGVYMGMDMWVNGQHVGSHSYGYTPFYFEIGKYLNEPGIRNIIAVRVNNTGKNSRWYSGSGIYRNVWLSKTNVLHIEPWGIAINTVNSDEQKARIHIGTKLKNDGDRSEKFRILTTIFILERTVLAQAETNERIKAGESRLVEQSMEFNKVELWSPGNPFLYHARVDIFQDNKLIESKTTLFGVRIIEFSAAKGFLLNGKSVKLKGACIHHDNGLLGSAAFDRAEIRRVEILKANGFNAIRTSHNPPSESFIDACDRLGMLVVDEAFDMWEAPKNPEDYHLFFAKDSRKDIESMILRDRNHPSVIMWSIGNEIHERADSSGVQIARNLTEDIHRIDNTRPITAAICEFWDQPGRKWDDTKPAFQYLDVGGYNYQWKQYEPDHLKYPDRLMMGTESVPKEAFENWEQVLKHDWVIGDFVWTGMDYLGETGIGHVSYGAKGDNYQLKPWPWYDSWCGDIDICGFKKAQSYYRDVVWGQSPVEIEVHVPLEKSVTEKVSFWGWPEELTSWTWPGNEGRIMDVNVYSRSEKVKLYLNDKLIGEQIISDTSRLTARFKVAYQPGVLKAIAFSKDKEIGTKVLTSAGTVKSIKLIADRPAVTANRNDLSYITVEAIDEKGMLVPEASSAIKVSVSGNGELLACGNGSPNDMKSFRSSVFHLFQGRGLIILRPTLTQGSIRVAIESPGLKNAALEIKTE